MTTPTAAPDVEEVDAAPERLDGGCAVTLKAQRVLRAESRCVCGCGGRHHRKVVVRDIHEVEHTGKTPTYGKGIITRTGIIQYSGSYFHATECAVALSDGRIHAFWTVSSGWGYLGPTKAEALARLNGGAL